MTTIKTSCPVCGDVELTPAQMRLVVCNLADRSFYAFSCGTCRDEVRKPADDEVVALLVSGGVIAERWEIPAEALEDHTGPRSPTTTSSTSRCSSSASTWSPRSWSRTSAPELLHRPPSSDASAPPLVDHVPVPNVRSRPPVAPC